MADQLRAVFNPTSQPLVRKDKLAQSKLHDRELREARRSEVQASKQANAERRRTQLLELKAERQLHETKRAAKDKREAARKEAHAATGRMCEHGVWRCKICYPHKQGKPLPVTV